MGFMILDTVLDGQEIFFFSLFLLPLLLDSSGPRRGRVPQTRKRRQCRLFQIFSDDQVSKQRTLRPRNGYAWGYKRSDAGESSLQSTESVKHVVVKLPDHGAREHPPRTNSHAVAQYYVVVLEVPEEARRSGKQPQSGIGGNRERATDRRAAFRKGQW